MAFRTFRFLGLLALAIAFGSWLVPQGLLAQVGNNAVNGGGANGGAANGGVNGGGQNGQNNNNNNNNNGGGGGGGRPIAGVEIDATGVLRMKVVDDPTGRLLRDVVMAARAKLAPEMVKASERRYVSLNRLEASIRERLAKNQGASEEMKYLAGLTRLEYVFYLPESKDIVIAGPAEGFALDPAGRAIGITTGRSVLELQDLIVALRAFPPGRQGANVISVSIDPTQDGLARMQDFLASLTGITPGDAQFIAAGLQNSLGMQTVSIQGVSPRTHFAQVLVEADYRMKLIGIGLEIPPAPIASYVSRASPSSVSKNAMERWFFVPNYECVRVAADGRAMQLVGDGVKLIGANERVNADGKRIKSGGINKASQAFCQQFTAQYPTLAKRSPVYAQMRNLIDMTVAAAWIQQQNFFDQAGWKMDLLRDEASLPVETHNTPKQVETAVNVVWKGNTLMTPIGGGVSIEPRDAFSPGNLLADDKNVLQAAKDKVSVKGVAPGWWWWD